MWGFDFLFSYSALGIAWLAGVMIKFVLWLSADCERPIVASHVFLVSG
jgi:hypothetical protein